MKTSGRFTTRGFITRSVPVLAILAIAVSAAPAAAQVNIQRPAPPAERGIRVDAPPLQYETPNPLERQAYPTFPPVYYDPAFIEPFVRDWATPQSTGRIGLSGWTSENPPLGAPVVGHRELNGWLGFGLTFTWGGPPPAKPGVSLSTDAPSAAVRDDTLVPRTQTR